MIQPRSRLRVFCLVAMFACGVPCPAKDPLPSWNDGPAKRAIIKFVETVTDNEDAAYIPPGDRIATFDNDGTLWCEQPMYPQMVFAFDRIKAMAPDHPDWTDKPPFRFVLTGDLERFAATGQQGLLDVITTTHSGMTVDEFEKTVLNWLRDARHPRFHRPYQQCIYLPMRELLQYLREKQFKTFVVSGGGIDFMRPWVDRAYGIPTEQVVGSSGFVRYEEGSGGPVLRKLPKVQFIDDGPGKPVGIHQFIGRRPVMAFGNSDGDYEMLRWTTDGKGARFGLIVHHTDAEREYAYDNPSQVGQLKRALADAPRFGWTVVNMKTDWKTIFPEK